MRKGKDAILRLLKGGEPVQYRQMLKALGLSRGDRSSLEDHLDRLVESGEIVMLQGRSYVAAGGAGHVRGKLSVHRDGYGFIVPEDGGEDLFVPARYLTGYMNSDVVEAQVVSTRRDGKREGRVTALVQRGVTEVVGRFEALGKGGRVIPDDPRLGHDVLIVPGAAGTARTGQVVLAQILTYPDGVRGLQGRITEVLGEANDPEVEVLTVIKKYELPNVFGEEVLAEALKQPQQVPEEAVSGRTDLRGRLTVTIDGETARDFDDAVSVAHEGELIRLWVSIADVSHYVQEGSKLDAEAYLRGTSVYFPDRCIPMLPEQLSNGICSLNPEVDRLTMTAEMLFDKGGAMTDSRFYTSVIRSSARLTYTTVKQILVDRNEEAMATHAGLLSDLRIMEELSLRLNSRRRSRGSIDFDLPEPQIILDLQGETTDIIRAERNLAHRIIEEFMLAANEAVASFLEETPVPSLYRVHENPDPLKLRDLAEFVFSFGYELKMQEDKVNPAALQKLLAEVEGKPEERLINEVLLRCMKQARYAAENLGHFGLASRCYCHFTSPIRRYPDLVVHRILRAALAVGFDSAQPTQKTVQPTDRSLSGAEGKRAEKQLALATERLAEIGEHTSKRERVAMEAEWDVVELKKVQFMQRHLGEEFDGFITGVTAFGFFVELEELFVEGLVHITTLDDDLYNFVEKQHSLIGRHTKRVFRIGDKTRVKVAAVIPATRRIEFVMVEHTVSAPPVRGAVASVDEFPRIPIRGKRVNSKMMTPDNGKKTENNRKKKPGSGKKF